LQFALLPGTEPKATSLRAAAKKTVRSEEALAPKRSGKSKKRQRNVKSKGKR